ncbi:MAG: hypothetical protein ACREOA_03310 [Candidatus Dormibacteria bacterium]
MAKLLYVEPSDEITDLIDRIRRAEEDRDLVFVVPPDGRVLRSPLDMRLLMQYTRGFQKRIAIVTGDPQIQALAIRTGFPTFASLARLEQGAPLRAAPEAAAGAATGTAAGAAAVASGAGAESAVAPVAAAPGSQLARRGPTGVIAAGGAGAAGWWSQIQGLWESQRGRQRLIALCSAGVIVVLILIFFLLPSATVTLGVRAHPLVDTVTVQGNDGQTGSTLDEVTTQGLQSQTFTGTFTITPSGTQSLPPVPATGDLEFCWSTGTSGLQLSFQGNAPEFQDTSASGVGFTTTTGGESASVAVPNCPSYSQGVPVQGDANTVGTAGNVGSSQSWNWSNYGASGCVSPNDDPTGCIPGAASRLQITNGSAMTGGKNATTQSVFSTTDATAAQQKQQSLDNKLTQKANKQLKRLAGKSVLAVDSKGKGIVVTLTNPTLPSGCNTSASAPCPAATAQTLTVTLSAAATAYSPAAVKAAVLKDLKSKVPKHAELLDNPDLGTPKVVAAGAAGAVTFSSRAKGYWAPKLDLAPLRGKLASMGTGSAKSYLLARLPKDSTVTISQSPIGWPWLPILSSHIHLVRESLAQGHTTG